MSVAKSDLMALELMLEASTTDAAIQKNFFISETTTLDLNDIMKIVNSLKGAYLLIKHFNERVDNKVKE